MWFALHVAKPNVTEKLGGAVAGKFTVGTLEGVDVSPDMLTKVSLIGIALMTEGAGKAGISGLHLAGKMVL